MGTGDYAVACSSRDGVGKRGVEWGRPAGDGGTGGRAEWEGEGGTWKLRLDQRNDPRDVADPIRVG